MKPISIDHDERGLRPAEPPSHDSAFTLTELVTILAVIAVLAVTLFPALANNKPNTQAARCLNNHRQLAAAWRMYSEDYTDSVANNFGVVETSLEITTG